MVIRIGSKEARQRFSDLIGQVHYGGQVVIIERAGKPMAALIPLEMYERMVAEREARFKILDDLRARRPGLSPEEVEREVAAALQAVRAADAEGGS